MIFSIIEYPLREIYFKGPNLKGLGFWEGKENTVICSELTSVSEQVWLENQFACDEIVDKNYESFKVLVYCGLLLFSYFQIFLLLPKLFYSCSCFFFNLIHCTVYKKSKLKELQNT